MNGQGRAALDRLTYVHASEDTTVEYMNGPQSDHGVGERKPASASDTATPASTLDTRVSDIMGTSTGSTIGVSTMDTIANIRSMRAYASGTSAIISGPRWYRRTAQYCDLWARAFVANGWSHITPLHIGAVLAAHSANTEWSRNIRLASAQLRMMLTGTARVCRANITVKATDADGNIIVKSNGKPKTVSVPCPHYGTTNVHPVHTLSANTAKAIRIMSATSAVDIETILSPVGDNIKTVAFAYACSGDFSHCVVDRHALRIAYAYHDCETHGINGCATNGKHGCGYVPVGDEYRSIADAYAYVADEFNEPVAFTQAITWVATRVVGWNI